MNKVWALWIQIYAFIVYFLIGIVVLICMCWVLACSFVMGFLTIMYVTQFGLWVFPTYFSDMPAFLEYWLPAVFVDYFKSPESEYFLSHDVFWKKINDLVYEFHNKYQKELLLIASSLWCTINLWWFPISTTPKKIEDNKDKGKNWYDEMDD